MQTRSSSASSVAAGATKKSYTPEETDIILQRMNEKERQLKEQADALQIKQDRLTRMQEEIEHQEQPAMSELLTSMNTIVNQIEKINSRIARLEISQGENKNIHQESERLNSRHDSQYFDMMDQPSPIRLKDAIDTIPKFDGHKMSVYHFSKICIRALELIPQYHEYHLVQLIINKLQGHAYAAIEGDEYHTVLELTKRLKLLFGSNKSVDQYRGELANVYMKQNENIFDYITRVQELRTAIIDGETDSFGNIDEQTKDSIEAATLNSFINGLPSDLLVRVKLEHPRNFKDSISIAVQLSKTIEAENIRKRTFLRPNFQPRADPPNNSSRPNYNINKNKINGNDNRFNGLKMSQPPLPLNSSRPYASMEQTRQDYQTKVCRYCKTPGHLIQECRKLAYRKALEGNQLNNSGNQQGVPLKSDVRRNDLQKGRPTYHIKGSTKANLEKSNSQEEKTQPPESAK